MKISLSMGKTRFGLHFLLHIVTSNMILAPQYTNQCHSSKEARVPLNSLVFLPSMVLNSLQILANKRNVQ